MFNNYAIVQGVDHVVPVDIYLPGCPPRPEMLIDAILKLHQQIQNMPSSASNREEAAREAAEEAALEATPDDRDEGAAAVSDGTAPHDGRTGSAPTRTAVAQPPRPATAAGREAGRASGAACSARTTRGDTSGYGGLVRPSRCPAPAQRPYGGWFDEVADALEGALPEPGRVRGDAIEKIGRRPRRAHVPRRARAPARRRPDPARRPGPAVRALHRASAACTTRTTTAASCTPSTTCCRSPTTGRIRLEVSAPDADPHIPSVVSVYPTNDWHERETYDFFGIVFDGHPALTRIMMPDDWPGHPQRKDYPLGGIPVEYKGAQIPPPDQRRSYS